MRRALLALTLVAAGIATASASSSPTTTASVPTPTAGAPAKPGAEMLKTAVRVQAPDKSLTSQREEPASNSPGGVLATLALIGVIAVRRYRARNA